MKDFEINELDPNMVYCCCFNNIIEHYDKF